MKQAGLLWKSYHYWAWMIFFGFLLPGVTSSRELDPAAVAFGSYPAVWGARISPDGQRIAYLRMHESDLPVAEVYDLENKKVTRIVASVKDEFDVKECTWASDERLLCSFYSAHKDAPFIFPVTRLVGVDVDGSRMKVLLQDRLSRDGVWSQFQDHVIDLLRDEPMHILIAMPDREGLGVARLNIYSGTTRPVERSHGSARGWMTDGKGDVRVRMMMNRVKIKWQARKSESQSWDTLHEEKLSDLSQHYRPLGFGEGADELLVARLHEGKVALWSEDLSGEKPDRLIFSHPDVDVNSVKIRTAGRDQRLVGVGYVTDRLHYHFFDEKLKQVHDRIAPLFPGDQIEVFDESWDGRFYLVRTSSDTSPGRLYRFDSTENDLASFVDQYPKLNQRSLASMKSLEYPARDGTLIPAYVTTPS